MSPLFSLPRPARVRPLFALAILALTGCQTYQEKNRVIVFWEQNRLADAEREATARANQAANSKDAIVWRLEQGAVLRATGKYQESLAAFAQAEAEFNRYDESARVKLGREAAALLSNPATLPYEGRAYDKVMVNVYQAMNAMLLGDFERARVEMFRAHARQQEAVADNARRIERTQAAAPPGVQRARHDAQMQAKLENTYRQVNSLRAYADYVNPFAVYLDGLFFLGQAADASDLERSRKSFERVLSMIGEHPLVRQDFQLAERALAGQPLPATTYVIFETGIAPSRGQQRIDIPIFSRQVPYLGAAWPTLEFHHQYLQALHLRAGGVSDRTHPVCSLDSVIAQEFRNELPSITTRTIASTLAKAAATYGIQEGLRDADQQLADFGALLAGIFQFSVNIADTRTWTTLPKEFQIGRFPTPADRRLEISTGGAGHKTNVTIGEGVLNVIFVKSITPGGPLIVSQTRLK